MFTIPFQFFIIILQYKLHDNFTIVSSEHFYVDTESGIIAITFHKTHCNRLVYWYDMQQGSLFGYLWATKWNVIHCILMKPGLISILTNLLWCCASNALLFAGHKTTSLKCHVSKKYCTLYVFSSEIRQWKLSANL